MDDEDDRSTAVWPPLLARIGDRVRLTPVGEDPAANRAWVDRDIASLAEGMFGEHLDATRLDDAARARVAARLPPGWRVARVAPGELGWTRWWVEEAGAVVGTMALASPLGGRGFLRVASVYTEPRARGRGAAASALDLAQDAAVVSGLWGIGLDTLWTWFHPVRFYLRRGFWLRHWKDDLRFVRGPHLPRHVVDIGAEEATFSVHVDGAAVPLLRAGRRGQRLEWHETAAFLGQQARLYEATPTFALALAVEGWPLYRSAEAWDRSRMELDVGGPEALSRRIERWEALARRDGLTIQAPRVPGVRYREWEELAHADDG